MIAQYFLSSSTGDRVLTSSDLRLPFKISLTEFHPFITLNDYFRSIEEFIFSENGNILLSALCQSIGTNICKKDIKKIIIRSEKHGALYHVSSVEVFTSFDSIKFAVNAALSKQGKTCLNNEYNMLGFLRKKFKHSYVPKRFFKREIKCLPNKTGESFFMVLAEWFDNYHEWHFVDDEIREPSKICIWNRNKGNRLASKHECYEIFRQASSILTYYYDTKSYNQIYPCYNAAGDFVVRSEGKKVNVKLTAARAYEPVISIIGSFSHSPVNIFTAIVYFFLDLSLRMRLDRINGTGKVIFAASPYLEAITEGFLDGIRLMEAERRHRLGEISCLVNLMKTFSQADLKKIFYSLLIIYQNGDPENLAIIEAKLDDHIHEMYEVIKKLH